MPPRVRRGGLWLALEAWWLATTNRWRTTPALHRGPTKPVLCSRIREHLEASVGGLSGALRGSKLPDPRSTKGWGPFRLPAPCNRNQLLDFCLGAGVDQLLQRSVG